MNFRYTAEAKKWICANPEKRIPTSIKECLSGINSIVGVNAPNIEKEIESIDSLISSIKKELTGNIFNLTHKSADYINALNISFHDIIDNIQVILVTEKDEGNETLKDVRNFFKYQKLGDIPGAYEDVNVPKREINFLGVYIPAHGVIMLWIDKLFEYEITNNDIQPELSFQKVLLHELIHALYDIRPRRVSVNADGSYTYKIIGSEYNKEKDLEETYDNTLVLRAYKNHPEVYPLIRTLISNQPKQYSDAITVFDIGEKSYEQNIHTHLTNKVEYADPSFDESKILHQLNYSIEDDDNESEKTDDYINWVNVAFEKIKDLVDYIGEETVEVKNAYSKIITLKESIKTNNRVINRIVVKLDKRSLNYYLVLEDCFIYRYDYDINIETLYDFHTKQVISEDSAGFTTEENIAKLFNQLILIVNENSYFTWKNFILNESN